MKKFGFTLAEVLISLGIIGVIAAITLPTFTANIQNQSNASKLSATVSTLENAFSAIIAGEGYDDFEEAGLYDNYLDPDILNRYLKGARECNGSVEIYGSATPFKTISGGNFNGSYNASPCFVLKSGAVFFGRDGGDDTSCGFLIDVNGADLPNKLGRDVFRFDLHNNGTLTPVGGNGSWRTSCSNANKGDGSACTGRLIENNYKVDY